MRTRMPVFGIVEALISLHDRFMTLAKPLWHGGVWLRELGSNGDAVCRLPFQAIGFGDKRRSREMGFGPTETAWRTQRSKDRLPIGHLAIYEEVSAWPSPHPLSPMRSKGPQPSVQARMAPPAFRQRAM